MVACYAFTASGKSKGRKNDEKNVKEGNKTSQWFIGTKKNDENEKSTQSRSYEKSKF